MDRADLVCITLLIHNTLIIQAFLPKALMPENQSKLFGLRITNDTQYSWSSMAVCHSSTIGLPRPTTTTHKGLDKSIVAAEPSPLLHHFHVLSDKDIRIKGAVRIQYSYGLLHFLNFGAIFIVRIVSQSHKLF